MANIRSEHAPAMSQDKLFPQSSQRENKSFELCSLQELEKNPFKSRNQAEKSGRDANRDRTLSVCIEPNVSLQEETLPGA